jgi:Spy/CpxP family protein refolding chaperone
MINPKWFLAIASMLLVASASSSFAQAPAQGNRQGGPGGGAGGPGGGRNFDPAQFRQMQLDRIQKQLAAPDDEWKVLQPKIEAVMTAQQNSRGGGGGGPPRNDQTPPRDESPVQKASRELRAAVESKTPSPDDVKEKLAAYRQARADAKAKLQEAQKALQEVLTAQQEAVFVSSGMLE